MAWTIDFTPNADRGSTRPSRNRIIYRVFEDDRAVRVYRIVDGQRSLQLVVKVACWTPDTLLARPSLSLARNPVSATRGW
jgi:hypothetical protein